MNSIIPFAKLPVPCADHGFGRFFYGNAINKILILTVFISIITIDFNMLIR